MKVVQLVIDFLLGVRRVDPEEPIAVIATSPRARDSRPSLPPERISKRDRRSIKRVHRSRAEGPLTQSVALRSYGVRRTRRTLRNDLAPAQQQALAGWMQLWGVPGLEERLDVRFSGRLTRSLGRCHPARGLIRLKRTLEKGDEALLSEVLCHEAAHAAVYAIHRRRVRPHGREWGQLMRVAGYRPRATYRVAR